MTGFLLGSIPSGLLIGFGRGVDLRLVGSRNIGATNAFRVLGARWGMLVFALDALKGAAAALVTGLLALALPSAIEPRLVALAAGVAAILGHIFTPWLGFKGGRGVATSLGVFLGLLPYPTLAALALWVLLVWMSRRVSVGSVGAAVVYPFLVAWLNRGDPQQRWALVVSIVVALLVIVRHSSNIRRLLQGTEPPIMGTAKGGRP